MKPPRLLEDNADTSIFPAGLQPEPYGEVPYLDLIDRYAREGLERRNRGVEYLVLRGMPDLHQARAAVLGARSTGLPVYVSLTAIPNGRPIEAEELLGSMLCLQELGIAAFGLDFGYVTGGLLELISMLAPYAKVPLLARPQGATAADRIAALIQAGGSVLCCEAADQQQVEAIKKAIADTKPIIQPSRFEDSPLLLCDGTGVYYLEEDFTLSDEIQCCRDMAEEILEREDHAVDALCFHVETVDDAHHLGQNVHMVRSGVCILAEGAEALEMALVLYSGRALIDARSDVEEATLQTLAHAYGAIVR